MVSNSNNNGKKVNSSKHSIHVIKLVYDGVPHSEILRILKERYGFYCSLPSLESFIKNYYPDRLREMQDFSKEVQSDQTGHIKTFIDESLTQANDIKKSITVLTNHIKKVEDEISFVQKFEKMFCNAFDKYVEQYNEEDPKQFLNSDTSEDEKALKSMVDNMGAQGAEAISLFISTHNTTSLLKLFAILQSRLLVHREALVRIHKELFKGYRNYSILQELTVIFEKYNAIIVEEFFPDKNNMDMVRFESVRKKILSLFDEFQIRYQGIESPKEVSAMVVEEPKSDADTTRASRKLLKDTGTEFLSDGVIDKEIKELGATDELKKVFDSLGKNGTDTKNMT